MARKVLGILAGVMLGVAAAAGSAAAAGDKIVVASKIDTERALLGNSSRMANDSLDAAVV